MKALTHILPAALTALLSLAAEAPAQEGSPWWERPLLAPRGSTDADRILAAALHHEKALGRLDSAIAGYRRVLELHAQHRATPATAARAGRRLQRLVALDLAAPTRAEGSAASQTEAASQVTGRLQLAPDRAAGAIAGSPSSRAADRMPFDHRGPLEHRRRWLQRALRLRAGHRTNSSAPPWLATVGSGVEAVRSALGLKGVPYFVESQLRRPRERSLTAHERWLLALLAEKEYRNFGDAERRYRKLVQLDPTGGIATRLSVRARLGVERCARWQRRPLAGS